MISITNEQIDFILSDFEKHGIVLEDLRDNLLDHMCCIIENEMQEDDDFYRFYESVLPRFFKEKLKEIQVETDNLLRFKNFYSMKKIMKISGVLTAFFIVTGAILKTFHLPGAGITIVLGGFLFSLIFLPLLIAIKLKDEDSKIDKAVFSLGFLLAMAMSAGLIFKLMHWPGANLLMLGGTIIFTFIYVPIYFITRIRRPELKFNTIVNSVMMVACGGIFFAMFNLGGSKDYDNYIHSQNEIMHQSTLVIFNVNDQMYVASESNELASQLHSETKGVNVEIQSIISMINSTTSAGNIADSIHELSNSLSSYNTRLSDFNVIELKEIDIEPLNFFGKIESKVGVSILTNIQQQIALNENIYLNALLKK